MKYIVSLTLVLMSLGVFAQETTPVPNRASEPTAYPASTELDGAALKRFDASFSEQNVGFFHVYADPKVDPEETYLIRGNEMKGVALEMLPKKYKKMAAEMEADVYAAGAIRGMNENLYLVRMDGVGEDRVEMFAIRGNEVEHLQTLAIMKKQGTRTKQMDSFITDIDGDSYLDLITVKANSAGEIGKRSVYVMDRNSRSWKKTKKLDAPWDSVELYDPEMDKL